MPTVNPLTGLPVGTVPLKEVLGQAGLEFLRGILAGRYPMPPMSAVIPVAPLEVEAGRAAFRALPEERFYNPIGSIHGGHPPPPLHPPLAARVPSTPQPPTAPPPLATP